MEYRLEKDSMGSVQVPKNAYFGAQTARSLHFFKIGKERFSHRFIRAYALVKQAAAKTNQELGLLSPSLGQPIEKACEDIQKGLLETQFPLSIWQTGSGTQTNMNLNEVIANRAIELLGGQIGSKTPIHPNDHVNMGQSTNDTFPTAMHVAICLEVQQTFLPALEALIQTFDKQSKQYASLIKMGRTHLQDATPITLGQEISGWMQQLKDAKKMILSQLEFVYPLAAGGTAVGTGLNTHPQYAVTIAKHIAQMTQLPFVSAENKFAALAGHEPLVALSGALNALACALMKIANDIRWLASGPRGGLGEITLAENEPGSSIMPGKVNPTQCEALTMVCCQVFGHHTAITLASSQGNFELNVFKPIIVYNILNALDLLRDSMYSFNEHCAQSIQPNHRRLNELQNLSLMLVTALAPKLGYDQAAKIAKKAHHENKTLKEVVLELGLMSEAEFNQTVKAQDMLGPS